MLKKAAVLCSILLAGFAISADFEDREAAMIVTSVDVAQLNQGRVLAYFPNVLISKFALDKTKGFFIFDADDVRGTKINTQVQDGTKHIVSEEEFLEKLQIQIPELKSMSNDTILVPSPTDLTEFDTNKPLERFLMSKDQADNQSQPFQNSVIVRIGTRADIKKDYAAITANPSEGGKLLYQQHFASMPLRLEVFESQPGHGEQKIGEADGFSLVKHKRQEVGYMVIPAYDGGGTGTLLGATVRSADNNAYEFDVDADAMVKRILLPTVWEEGGQPNLQCYIPEDPEYKSKTACQVREENGKQVTRIIGQLQNIEGGGGEVTFYLMDPQVDTSVYRVRLTRGTTGAGTAPAAIDPTPSSDDVPSAVPQAIAPSRSRKDL